MKALNLMVVCFVSLFLNQNPTGFKYLSVPQKYTDGKTGTSNERQSRLDSLVQPYYLEKNLPANYVKDGTVDYTSFIQKGINDHNDIVFPNFPVLVSTKGLSLKSNTKVYFQNKSNITIQPNNSAGYEILKIKNLQNVQVYYPNITGDKGKHMGTNGEWGFGISIRGSSNIRIENPVVSSCQGDGIYIGFLAKPSDNIIINNALVDNSRRNGLSITSGTDITINSCVFSNSSGKGPGSGIDIEPNNNNDELKNIDVLNAVTFNNEHWGILVNLVNLRKGGDQLKDLNINIQNHTDDNSDYGMALWLTRKGVGNSLTGKINVSDAKWMNNRSQGLQYFENDFNSNNVNVSFSGLKVFKKNGNNSQTDSKQIEDIKSRYSKDKHFRFSGN